MHLRPLRLAPGDDLRRALEAAASQGGHRACFVVSGIGSLDGAALRFAAEAEPTRLAGPFEILSLAGTLSEGGVHLHMAIADGRGRVVGRHVCEGNLVRTTAEVLLASLSDWRLRRAPDATTGHDELVVTPIPHGGA